MWVFKMAALPSANGVKHMADHVPTDSAMVSENGAETSSINNERVMERVLFWCHRQ